METLRKVAQILASHGQKDLVREVGEISLQVKKTAASEVELKNLDGGIQGLQISRGSIIVGM